MSGLEVFGPTFDGAVTGTVEVSNPFDGVVSGEVDVDEVAGDVAITTYEFGINGVNFNDYSKIKTLTLDGNAEDDDPITLHDDGEDYVVPSDPDKVFIAFQALVWLQQTAMIGRIGESDSADGAISKEVLKLSNGTLLPFMTNCYGVFTAGKYITAESDSANDNYTIQSGSVLYGVEIDA